MGNNIPVLCCDPLSEQEFHSIGSFDTGLFKSSLSQTICTSRCTTNQQQKTGEHTYHKCLFARENKEVEGETDEEEPLDDDEEDEQNHDVVQLCSDNVNDNLTSSRIGLFEISHVNPSIRSILDTF